MTLRLLAIALVALLTSACTNDASTTTSSAVLTPAKGERHEFVAKGRNGAVAAAHHLASEAGIAMLKKGGNAVDAAVATSFMISVVRPQSTGIGGGGFLLYYDAKAKRTKVYDFRERAPAKASRDMYLKKDGSPADFQYNGKTVENASVNGHLSVGIPGLVAGLIKVHADAGSLPLADVIAPAIRVARDGFPVYPSLAASSRYRAEVLQHFEDSRELYLVDGKPMPEGHILKQPDLARTLELIAKNGRAGFYEGPVAAGILAEMKRGKGLITAKDLADYKVKMREPVSTEYRGYKVVSMPPPSSGGIHIVQMLKMLSHYDYGAMGFNTSGSWHLLAEVMRRAFADRAKYLGDPDFFDVPIAGLTDDRYNEERAKTINLKRASNSKEIGAGTATSYESPSTTHLSVVDKWGNAIASTQTVNYSFGSCVVAKGTGVVLNNEMDDFSKKPGVPNVFGLVGAEANAIAAGKTPLSSMSPTIVFRPDGELDLVVGSPGGPRIINATLQTVLNVIDHGMALPNAVHAPRIHHQWLPDELRIEKEGIDAATRKKLEKLGHKLVVKGAIGDVQAVGRSESGWVGVSDVRSEGRPAAY